MLKDVDESLPHEGLPYGVRGTGNMICWGAPAVIANAIYNAIGVRINNSPMTAGRVVEALGKEVRKCIR